MDDVGLVEASIDGDEVASGMGLPSTYVVDDVRLLQRSKDGDEVDSGV